MKKLYFSVFAILISSAANTQSLQWAHNIGSPDQEIGFYVASDLAGNVYSIGAIWDLQHTDFDPGPGVFNLISAGLSDMYVWKLDAAGNFLWAKTFKGANYAGIYAINIDPQQNIIITGKFDGIVDFDPDSGVYNLTSPSISDDDIFFCKLNPDGELIWVKQLEGHRDFYGGATALDLLGNIYITGAFLDTADFDPGPSVYNLITTNGIGNIYLAKYDPDGNLIWAKSMGGTSWENPASIVVDANQNIYTTGDYSNTADFDPGPGVANLSTFNLSDIFVTKYDGSGNFIWAKGIGGSGNDDGRKICLDGNTDVYVLSQFDHTVDFDPGAGVSLLTGNAFDNYSVTKLDSAGNFIWTELLGGWIFDMSVNNSGDIIYTGDARIIDDVDPGPNTYYFPFHWNYIAKLNSNGMIQNITPFSVIARPNSLSLVSNTEILITGQLRLTADMDIPNQVNLTSFGDDDIFIAKYSQVVLWSNSILNETGFTVFPNPSNGRFYVNFPNQIQKGNLEIVNTSGQVVYRKEINATNFASIYFEGTSGIYIMRVLNDEGVTTRRIVRQ